MQNHNNNKKQINPLPFKAQPPDGSEPCYLFSVLYVWGRRGKIRHWDVPRYSGWESRRMHCSLPMMRDWACFTPSNQYPAGLQIQVWKRTKTHPGAAQLQGIWTRRCCACMPRCAMGSHCLLLCFAIPGAVQSAGGGWLGCCWHCSSGNRNHSSP